MARRRHRQQLNHGLKIVAEDESSIYTWRRYRSANYTTDTVPSEPKLIVNYNSYPNAPTVVEWSPQTKFTDLDGETTYYSRSATPTLSAEVSDPDGGDVTAVFDVYDGDRRVISDLLGKTVSSGGISTAAVPAGTLSNGTTYRVVSHARDAALTSTTGTSSASFEVDTAAPDAPEVYAPEHAEELRTAATSGMFFWESLAVDVAGYRYGMDVNPPIDYRAAENEPPTLTTAAGSHTLYVRAVDHAGNLGPVTAYAFGVGATPTAPTAPTGLAMTPLSTMNGTTVTTSRNPTFAATGSDSDGGNVGVQFEIWANDSVLGDPEDAPVAEQTVVVTSGSTARWTAPTDADGEAPVQTGEAYVWRVRTFDGAASSPWSQPRPFVVTSSSNTAPSVASPTVDGATVNGAGQDTTDVSAPTLRVQVQDPEVDVLYGSFEIADAAGTVIARGTDSATGTSAMTWAPPIGSLADEKTYQWRARVTDNVADSTWTGWRALEVSLPPNRAPRTAGSAHYSEGDSDYSIATAVRDDDLDQVKAEVEVIRDDNGVTVFTGAGEPVSAAGISSVSIPDGTIVSGVTYRTRVRAHDGNTTSAWTAGDRFTGESGGSAAGVAAAASENGYYTKPKSTPVILVHAFDPPPLADADCKETFGKLRRRLKTAQKGYRAAFRSVRTVAYYNGDSNCKDVLSKYGRHHYHHGSGHVSSKEGSDHDGIVGHDQDANIRHLAMHLAWYIYDEYGDSKRHVSIVAHSMGGLVARYASGGQQGTRRR